jgi:hypothetical protein
MKLTVLVLLLMLIVAAPAAAQMPPTPTPLGPPTPHFTLPEEFSLWAGTSTAIQVWNWIGDGQVIVQGMAIIGLVIAGMFIVYRFVKQMTTKDAEE